MKQKIKEIRLKLFKSRENILELYNEDGTGEDRGFVKGKAAGLNVAINLLKDINPTMVKEQ